MTDVAPVLAAPEGLEPGYSGDDEVEEEVEGKDFKEEFVDPYESEYPSEEDEEEGYEEVVEDNSQPSLKEDEVSDGNENRSNENIDGNEDSLPAPKKIRTVKKVFRCSLCDFFSFNRESTEQHIRIHNEPQNTKLYYCSTCKYSTRIKPYFDKHRKLHSNTIVRPFKCSYCPYQGRFRSHTRAHEMRHHTGEKPFVCSLCERGFVEQHILARHMRTAHTDERPYVCDVCSRSYKQLNALRVHQRKHFDDAYVCEFCRKRFSTIHQLQRHLDSHQDKNIPCPVKGCSFKTINQQRIENHVKNYHKERVCQDCDFTTTIHKEYIRHKTVHSKKIIRTYKCPHCSKTFASIHNMKKHQVVHTGIREFQCNKCPYNTQKRTILLKHLELHHLIENNPDLLNKFMKCDMCDFICESKKILGVHKRIHNTLATQKSRHSDGSYVCSLCNGILNTREQLVEHLLLEHSNYRTNKCHHCKFTSTVLSEMSLHLDFHEIQSNESAHVHTCQQCGYLNIDHDEFADHLKKCQDEQIQKQQDLERKKRGPHKEIKPFKCPLCSTRVQSASSLKTHVISHSGVTRGRKHLKCNDDDSRNVVEADYQPEDPQNMEQKAYFCNMCDFYSTNAGAFTCHQKVHEMQHNSFIENSANNDTTNNNNNRDDPQCSDGKIHQIRHAEDEPVTDEGYEEELDSGAETDGLDESEELSDVEEVEMVPEDVGERPSEEENEERRHGHEENVIQYKYHGSEQ